MEIETGKNVIDIEIKALQLLKNHLTEEFTKAVRVLSNIKGKIIISGIGKSGHIAQKIASTFSSIGSSSFFVHPSEANHGDLGMITNNDCVLLISNSGETIELFNIILHCNKMKIPTISITSDETSTLAKKTQIVLRIPKNIEACPLELAPTSSTTVSLVLGDALAVALLNKKKFTKKDFSELHPGGKLGKMLLKVNDVMKTDRNMPLISSDKKMSEAIIEISSKGFGCVGIISIKKKELIGIITDGDLRRHMNSNLLDQSVNKIMTKKPKTLSEDTLITDALKQMNKESITNYFITKNKKPIGILHVHDILEY